MKRRGLLTLGVVSAGVLALGGGVLCLIGPGLAGGKLSAVGREVVAGASRGLMRGTLPIDPQEQRRALDSLLARVDSVISTAIPHAQMELSQLLSILATTGGRRAVAGLSEPWSTANESLLEDALQGMRTSGVSLRQQAYHALHEIVNAAYFAHPETWAAIGYPGPIEL